MNAKLKLIFASIITFKLLILLYISMATQLPVFVQLVLMPVLILETLGLFFCFLLDVSFISLALGCLPFPLCFLNIWSRSFSPCVCFLSS